MILSLKIENYALISSLELDFSKGLTIITGETGAGKTILLGALSLILGIRAEKEVLLDKNKKCYIEGIFLIKGYGLENFFEENHLDFDDNTIIRREINQNGKSRAFINDSPVTLNLLKILGEKLIDIHSQNKIITLNESVFQLAVVDNFAKNTNTLRQYKLEFKKYLNLLSRLEELSKLEEKTQTDKDYYGFLFDELEKANLIIDEQSELEQELQMLNNSELIKKHLFSSAETLIYSDLNIISQLKDISSSLKKISAFHPSIKEFAERLESCSIEIKDISKTIENLEKSISYSESRFHDINNRLDIIYSLQKKHRVSTIEELITIKNNLKIKLENISSLRQELNQLEKQLAEQHKFILKFSDALSNERKKQLPYIEKDILAILKNLGMPDAQFKIILNPKQEFSPNGRDDITFLFCANRGYEPKEISKVASGGELSRLMLSIKSIITQRNLLPTIIFDEIDTGISGEIASMVGNIILDMSSQMQVIAITHQPQIAAKGKFHYFVYKEIIDKKTQTFVRKLTEQERIVEIAKMISGKKSSKPATETAKELLNK